MSCADTFQPGSAALKNAIRWLGVTCTEHPETKRADLVREAGIRFDLTPAECEFLESNFADTNGEGVSG